MSQAFHNTTVETGQALKMAIEQAGNQDEKVLALFRMSPPGTLYSASQVYERCFKPPVPPTSARRSCTNLMKAGILEKTNIKRDGPLGRPEYCYRLRRGGGQMRLL